jgi:hypothetical protein
LKEPLRRFFFCAKYSYGVAKTDTACYNSYWIFLVCNTNIRVHAADSDEQLPKTQSAAAGFPVEITKLYLIVFDIRGKYEDDSGNFYGDGTGRNRYHSHFG